MIDCVWRDGGRPRCVPGVSWRPGQAVAATRRPGREGFGGSWRRDGAVAAQGRHEVGMCDGSSERSRSFREGSSWIVDPERPVVDEDAGNVTPSGPLKGCFRVPGTRCMSLPPYRGVKGWSRVRNVARTREKEQRSRHLPHEAGSRDRHPGAPPSRPRRASVLPSATPPNPRPSRPRPQPARAVAETAASHTSGASFRRAEPSPVPPSAPRPRRAPAAVTPPPAR